MKIYKNKKDIYRIELRIKELMKRKVLFIIIVIIAIALIIVLMNLKTIIINHYQGILLFKKIFEITLIIISILVPIVLVFEVFYLIGEHSAKNIENAVVSVFDSKYVENYKPILISKRYDKQNNLYLIFYNNLPVSMWNDKQEFIEVVLNCHYLEKAKYYKGNSHMIILVLGTKIDYKKRDEAFYEKI